MEEWLQIVGLFLLSSTKFLFAPSSATAAGYSFIATLSITILGGWFGVLVFYFFGRVLIDLILRNYIKNEPKKVKSPFTFTNKLIIRTKIKFGVFGLALLTPVLLSIPVGSIIAARYYCRDKYTVYILFCAVAFWSFVLTTVSVTFKILL